MTCPDKKVLYKGHNTTINGEFFVDGVAMDFNGKTLTLLVAPKSYDKRYDKTGVEIEKVITYSTSTTQFQFPILYTDTIDLSIGEYEYRIWIDDGVSILWTPLYPLLLQK